jgi:serine/threonine-protein kinase
VGKRIGRFAFESLLGRGGMGEVYKAWDENLHRYVAIKLIRPGHASSDDLARFRREAMLAAALDHPNIAPVFDVGEQDAQPYIVMKYIDGATLDKAHLADLRRLVSIMRDVARAVGCAHSQTPPVIHRDIKPQNVMLDRAGRAYVMDFGLAKSLSQGPSTLTASVACMGTPAYMAPEQARGRVKEVDARTDVYSLGASLYMLLAGKCPHPAETPQEMLFRIGTEPPDPLRRVRPDVPAALEAIVTKAMAREKADRYANASEMADALEAYLEGRAPSKAAPSAQRRPLRAFFLAAMAASLAMVGAAAVYYFVAQHKAQVEAKARDELRLKAEADARLAAEEETYLSGEPHVVGRMN